MAPSKESQALAELFEQMAQCFPSDGSDNNFQERLVYEAVHRAGVEAPGVSYEDVVIADRPCKWIRSDRVSSTQHVMLYIHGGGYTMGSSEGHRKLTGHLARACNCVALSVDYRLSPENKYPAALEDCVNVYEWLLGQGFKPEHIVVAGDSCGGGLATAVPLAALQRGVPQPAASVCLSPWCDLTGAGESMTTNEGRDTLNTRPFVKMLAARYVEGTGAEMTDPLVSPLFADEEDLKRLSPHWISVGELDMLRDDGIRLAEKVKRAGLEVVLEVHEGQQHVFEFMAGKAPEADESIRKIGLWVKEKIGS